MKEENNNNLNIDLNDDITNITSMKTEEKEEDNLVLNHEIDKIKEESSIQLEETNMKKNNFKVIIVSILLAIVLCGLGYFGFKLYSNYNNPKNRLLISMANYLSNSNIVENVSKINNIITNGANYSAEGSINIKTNDTSLIKGKLNLNIIDNPKNKEQYYNLKISNNNEQIIDLIGLFKDKKFYLKLEDIFDKFYYFEDMEYIKNVDTTYLKNNIVNSLNKYFSEDKFIMTKEVVNNKKLDKISVKLSERDFNDLFILIMDNISKDNNVLNAFVREDLKLEDIKTNLSDIIKNLKENSESLKTEDNFIYNLYLKKYDIRMQEIIVGDITLRLEGDVSGNLTLLSKDKVVLTGNYANNSLKLNISEDENYVQINITLENKGTDKEVITDYNLIVTGKVEENEIKVTSNIKLKINSNNSIPNLDISNSKLFEEMSEEESNQILINIQNISIVKDYMERIQNVTSNNNILDSEDYYNALDDNIDYSNF